MYKLLALDLDGTVLRNDYALNPHIKQVVQEIKEHCHVVIVTGRHHTAAKPYHAELGLTTPIICCNGTYIYDYKTDSVLKENSVNKQDALDFITLANEYQMKMVLYVTNAMLYSSEKTIAYMKELREWTEQYEESIRPDIREITSFTEQVHHAQHIWKFVIEGEIPSLENFLDTTFIKEKFNGERSWSNRVDLAAKGNSKGIRLAEYVKELGLTPQQVMAVGDNHNDISMLEYAGLGVAMGHADATVKQAANQFTNTDNHSDELAHLIREKIKGQHNE